MSIENKQKIDWNKPLDFKVHDPARAEYMAYAMDPYMEERSTLRRRKAKRRAQERGVDAAVEAGSNYDSTVQAEKAELEGTHGDHRIKDLAEAALVAYTGKPYMDKYLRRKARVTEAQNASDRFRADILTVGLIDPALIWPLESSAAGARGKAYIKMHEAALEVKNSHREAN